MDEEKEYKEVTEDDFDDDLYEDNDSLNQDDSEETEENESPESSQETSETEESGGQDESEDESDDRNDILKASESEKGSPEENKASFLNRNMLFIAVGSIFILFLFFCVFILPNITKRRSVQNNELDKAGKVFIPDEYEEDELSDDKQQTSAGTNNRDKTSSYLENLDSENTSISSLDNNGNAPVAVPSQMGPVQNTGSASSNYPQNTNRNELQKAMQRIPIDSYSSSSSANSFSGNTSQNQNYGNGGNSGISSYMAQKYGGGNYTPASLQSNIGAYLASQGGNNYKLQNDQSGKESFMNKERGNGGQYQWNSDFTLWKGTVIPAVLDTGINTDLPGMLKATVTTNVYSSNNGKYILVPQGSVLTGEYNSSLSYGQARIQIVWNTLIRPDGLEVNLGSMNGIDAYGFSGQKGHRTEHPFEYLKAMGLIAMFSIIDTKAANTINAQGNTYAQNALSDAYSAGQKLNEKIVDRALDIQPTIRVKSGTEVKLITNLTIELPPIEPDKPSEKYVRH